MIRISDGNYIKKQYKFNVIRKSINLSLWHGKKKIARKKLQQLSYNQNVLCNKNNNYYYPILKIHIIN